MNSRRLFLVFRDAVGLKPVASLRHSSAAQRRFGAAKLAAATAAAAAPFYRQAVPALPVEAAPVAARISDLFKFFFY
ncbi:Hypothetical predicted protein [Olea europaea subsp. europaea]|uniref:Uncharacterized protein n=1 Tax=Olea europaea subsp. europaea TaxID=158383 RepID=A0A8S0T798_OLEEU|nr:Hypothetical predicted protein [Olea europaea subsp. europaea]